MRFNHSKNINQNVNEEKKEEKTNCFMGTLTDQDIKKYVSEKKLISDNFDAKLIKQACYELRASNICYYLVGADLEKKVIQENEEILLRPNQIVVIITKETLNIPADILGRIMTKGRLFSLGVNAVNTYVDPGFVGRLGIVFQNQSTRYLKVPVGGAIAKIEFSKLHESVKDTYHGQHGYETNIWPLDKDYFVGTKELKEKFNIVDPLDEIGLLYGESLELVFKRVLKFERRMIIGFIIYSVITLLYLGFVYWMNGSDRWFLEPLVSIAVGVLANIIFGIVSMFVRK